MVSVYLVTGHLPPTWGDEPRTITQRPELHVGDVDSVSCQRTGQAIPTAAVLSSALSPREENLKLRSGYFWSAFCPVRLSVFCKEKQLKH